MLRYTPVSSYSCVVSWSSSGSSLLPAKFGTSRPFPWCGSRWHWWADRTSSHMNCQCRQELYFAPPQRPWLQHSRFPRYGHISPHATSQCSCMSSVHEDQADGPRFARLIVKTQLPSKMNLKSTNTWAYYPTQTYVQAWLYISLALTTHKPGWPLIIDYSMLTFD